ncbi:polysaccharide biosynthesis protein [Bifidobacterium ramosum]|uniref:Polysaccharide biosynthesis protein n=1 Tax=Bifidobacterium ramosum TaxID=1798158 RepID=A0A6L4WYE6_9BIFI|nr:O-unit flippase-like protein [Bifidobacterium ramosum]KAB8287251.1 polysaccharide biosynthesis protein [Bifidobacterium ramosum]NEG71963.1 hypothetical protein [Bifidobacterium ramosum]
MALKTKRSDIVWNYVGTIVSMTSGFILLPLLMRFLSGDELGLWYVYIAIANLAMLFEFGFTPTFSRNIVYVISGARVLSATGRTSSIGASIDWHLLNTVIRASKLIYGAIAGIALILLSTVGTAYIAFITGDVQGGGHWAAWILFCMATFFNLYFLYSIASLRGYGDVAGENQAKTISKIMQLIISGILLVLGYGLLGASIGYFANALVLRGYAIVRMRKHKDIEIGRSNDHSCISFREITSVLGTISHLAWRDGLVGLATYASTQATSILCSIFLSLEQTGTYSVLLQLGTAICNFAAAYPRSFFPAMQSAYAEADVNKQRSIISSGIVTYWIMFLLGTIGVMAVILPLLPLLKPGIKVDYILFAVLCLYLSLLQQHSIFCNYIISMNEIPYMRGFITAAVLGCVFVCIFCGPLHMGEWGLVIGQAFSQIIYNNWKWPHYLCKKMGISYINLWTNGLSFWRMRLTKFIGK